MLLNIQNNWNSHTAMCHTGQLEVEPTKTKHMPNPLSFANNFHSKWVCEHQGMLKNANGSPIQQPKATKISSVNRMGKPTVDLCHIKRHYIPQMNHTGGMKARHKTVHNVSPKSKEQSELACVECGFLSSDMGGGGTPGDSGKRGCST